MHHYADALRAAMAQAPGYVDYAPTYITPDSFDCALNAAGGLLAVVDALLDGQAESGFALIRPPGHHATRAQPMGFCLFNNLAIATRHLRSRGARRIFIVDFDVHHGNGTQDIFYDDPHVFFISTHQSGIYPGSGLAGETGSGAGRGATLNVPLPANAGDAAFARILHELIIPAAGRFQPEFILVSAGFDAHWSDPLASLQLTTTGYFDLAHGLLDLAREHCPGRLAFTLEGGYNPRSLADNVAAVLHALAGELQAPDPLGPARRSEPDISRLLGELKAVHRL